MKLSGWNLGHLQGHLFEKSIQELVPNRLMCASIFQAKTPKEL